MLDYVGLDREHVFFSDRAGLRAWLEANWEREIGVWAVYYKKSTGLSDMSWEVVVEECLCFGWIDSLPGKVDQERTKHYISPRKATSGWSSRNKKVVKELSAKGLMTESGWDAIRRAKANGAWSKMALSEKLIEPPELEGELRRLKRFRSRWDDLSASRKRTFLESLYASKTMPTKLKKIERLKKDLGLGK